MSVISNARVSSILSLLDTMRASTRIFSSAMELLVLIGCRNGGDFDADIFVNEPVDDEQRVRRKFPVGKVRRVRALAPLAVLGDIARVDQVRRELHDVFQIAALRLQRQT